MSTLLEPNIGEVLDRQSILRLKIEMGMNKGVSTTGWEEEMRLLDVYLTKQMRSWQKTATAEADKNLGRLIAELNMANTMLWRAEDELRANRPSISSMPTGDLAETIARIGLRIADLNDARSHAVQGLNKLFGIQTEGKIYGK